MHHLMPVHDAHSVSSYQDALGWLWGHSHVEDWAFDPQAYLPMEARLVCAIHWRSEEHLKRDLRKQAAGLFASPA